MSLISFGLAIERIGAQIGAVGASALFGIALAVLGCLALIMGTVEFFQTRRGIYTGDVVPTITAYMVVVVASLVLAGTFIIYVVVVSL